MHINFCCGTEFTTENSVIGFWLGMILWHFGNTLIVTFPWLFSSKQDQHRDNKVHNEHCVNPCAFQRLNLYRERNREQTSSVCVDSLWARRCLEENAQGTKESSPRSCARAPFWSLSGAEGKFKRHPDTYWEKWFWWGKNGPLCSIQITGKMSTEQASPMGKDKQASFRLNYEKQNMSLCYLNPPPFLRNSNTSAKHSKKNTVNSYLNGWDIRWYSLFVLQINLNNLHHFSLGSAGMKSPMFCWQSQQCLWAPNTF